MQQLLDTATTIDSTHCNNQDGTYMVITLPDGSSLAGYAQITTTHERGADIRMHTHHRYGMWVCTLPDGSPGGRDFFHEGKKNGLCFRIGANYRLESAELWEHGVCLFTADEAMRKACCGAIRTAEDHEEANRWAELAEALALDADETTEDLLLSLEAIGQELDDAYTLREIAACWAAACIAFAQELECTEAAYDAACLASDESWPAHGHDERGGWITRAPTEEERLSWVGAMNSEERRTYVRRRGLMCRLA